MEHNERRVSNTNMYRTAEIHGAIYLDNSRIKIHGDVYDVLRDIVAKLGLDVELIDPSVERRQKR